MPQSPKAVKWNRPFTPSGQLIPMQPFVNSFGLQAAAYLDTWAAGTADLRPLKATVTVSVTDAAVAAMRVVMTTTGGSVETSYPVSVGSNTFDVPITTSGDVDSITFQPTDSAGTYNAYALDNLSALDNIVIYLPPRVKVIPWERGNETFLSSIDEPIPITSAADNTVGGLKLNSADPGPRFPAWTAGFNARRIYIGLSLNSDTNDEDLPSASWPTSSGIINTTVKDLNGRTWFNNNTRPWADVLIRVDGLADIIVPVDFLGAFEAPEPHSIKSFAVSESNYSTKRTWLAAQPSAEILPGSTGWDPKKRFYPYVSADSSGTDFFGYGVYQWLVDNITNPYIYMYPRVLVINLPGNTVGVPNVRFDVWGPSLTTNGLSPEGLLNRVILRYAVASGDNAGAFWYPGPGAREDSLKNIQAAIAGVFEKLK